MNYSLLITLLVVLLLVLLLVNRKQQSSKKSAAGKPGRSTRSSAASRRQASEKGKKAVDGGDSAEYAAPQAAEADEQAWEWDDGGNNAAATSSVSAQEVDPLTEYQVYKQFGYEDKAAASLAGYLNTLSSAAPAKLVHELAGLSLNIGNIDLLAETLEKYDGSLPESNLAEYVKAGLAADSTNLPLRVLADRRLGWDMAEVARQIGEKTGLEESRAAEPALVNGVEAKALGKFAVRTKTPLVLGRADLGSVSEEEMEAVIGFVRPDKSAKLLQNKVDYQTVLQQYDRAIQRSQKPASLIIDALKLDYQHAEVNQFAQHLWKLYYSLGQYGRQVKERMLGWGYSLGYHEVFDDLETGPNEQKVREIGLAKGYLQPSALQMKSKYRDLVHKDDSESNMHTSPVETVIREVESLLMYGQLDQAVGTLEQAVLQYPQESQFYVVLFDLYERTEDWPRLEQFLRERGDNLPEEVVLAMGRLLRRVNQHAA